MINDGKKATLEISSIRVKAFDAHWNVDSMLLLRESQFPKEKPEVVVTIDGVSL